jgi:hypothetical protein
METGIVIPKVEAFTEKKLMDFPKMGLVFIHLPQGTLCIDSNSPG